MSRLFALLWCLLMPLPAMAAGRPNVLFIYTDDQRFDTIHALGNPEIQTPTLDGLVQRGFSFSNAYCQGGLVPAVCTPSRTMMLTGKSLFRIPDPRSKTYSGPTLGKVFRDAGYETLCLSKPGNSFRAAHEHFARVIHIPHSGAASNQKCADAAIGYLNETPKEKPFFIYYAPPTPHDPRTAEPEYHALYDPAKVTLSKNFMPKHPFDNGELAIRDEKLAPIPRTEKEMKRHLADYYASITSLDHHLGRILETLRTRGQLDNTLIVFTSDQGLAVGGRHGLMGKQNLYEHFKSPLVIAGPSIPKGKSDALVYLFDLFPTVCELSGVPAPAVVDGKSLVPILTGKQPAVRDELFAAYRDVQRMVRDFRWKLIWYPKIDRVQLFDLSQDADELNDLSARPEHASRVAEMKQRLAAQQKLWGDDRVK